MATQEKVYGTFPFRHQRHEIESLRVRASADGVTMSAFIRAKLGLTPMRERWQPSLMPKKYRVGMNDLCGTFSFRHTKSERDKVKADAAAAGMTMASWFRYKCGLEESRPRGRPGHLGRT